MFQLPGRHENYIEQLLHLWVSCLSVLKDFTNEVYRLLLFFCLGASTPNRGPRSPGCSITGPTTVAQQCSCNTTTSWCSPSTSRWALPPCLSPSPSPPPRMCHPCQNLKGKSCRCTSSVIRDTHYDGASTTIFCSPMLVINHRTRVWCQRSVTPRFRETKAKLSYMCPGCSNHTYSEHYSEQIQYLDKL
jgi:hypothetical protein